MSRRTLERQLARHRTSVKRLKRQADREGVAPDSSRAAALEDLSRALEELSAARLAAERHALRYSELFHAAPDAYVVTDQRGVIRDANRAAEAKLGRSARQLAGKPLPSFLGYEQRPAFAKGLLAIQRRRRARVANWEARFAPARAEPFWAAVSAAATHEPDGSVSEIRWLLRDVSEQRRAEEALRASEARLRLMADSLPVLISYVDREERYRFNNRAYERWFGISREKLFGQQVRELLGDAAYAAVREHIARALAGRTSRFEGEISLARAGPRQVSFLYAPHVDESGEVLGFYALVSDISERKRMEAELRAAATAAALAEDRERRRLARDLHDDLGQLLSLAGMKLGALREATAGSDLLENVREIEALVVRAHHHAESLTFQLSPPILHDRGLVPAAEWLAEDLGRSYDLRVEIAHDGAPEALDDAARVVLFRVLRELLINVARHAGTRDARVRIWRDGARVRVEVRDHGLGFDPAAARNGFGLLSARERLRSLGGDLEIHAAPGEGVRVVANLPVAARRPR